MRHEIKGERQMKNNHLVSRWALAHGFWGLEIGETGR